MESRFKYLSKPLDLYVNLCYTNRVVEQSHSVLI